jgi:hypothetical protein
MVVTTPYDREFLMHLETQSKFIWLHWLVEISDWIFQASRMNIRYYIIRLFDDGVESLYGKYKKELGGVFLTINIGMMY